MPFARHFEQARLVAHRAGERAAHVAEEFGFQQRFGQRGAVDGDKRTAGARALIVDHADDELFAGAALAVDQTVVSSGATRAASSRTSCIAALPAMKCFEAAWRATRSRNRFSSRSRLATCRSRRSSLLQTPVHRVANALDLVAADLPP